MSEEEFAKRTAHLSMDDLCKRGLQYISNKVLYGATSWYDWRCDNWGTKWNAYDTEIPGENLLVFTTAWGPPERVIATLAERYPHTDIEHWWADEDIGSNSGYIRYSHGCKFSRDLQNPGRAYFSICKNTRKPGNPPKY